MRVAGTWSRRITEPLLGRLAHATRLQRALLLIRRSVSEFRADHCPQMAAAISFHLLFSLFPLAITAVAVIGLVTQDPQANETVVNAILNAVPLSEKGAGELQKMLGSIGGGAGALGLLGLLGLLWTASGVMSAVRVALNVAWDTDVRRPFVRGKLVDLALIAGVFLVTGATLALSVAAGIARQRAAQLPGAVEGLAPLAGAAVSAGVFIASVALLFITFLLMYRLVPAVRTRIRDNWPGALAAAVGFTALQYGFSVYVAHFANYNKVYGSLGVVIAFLFFVYLASMVFLFGAEIAAEYPRLPAAPHTARPGGGDRDGGRLADREDEA